MHVEADILKSVVGNLATGPAGFNLHHKVEAGADIATGQNTIKLKLDDKTLADAHARNEGGVNKAIAAANPRMPGKASAAVTKVENRQAEGANRYAALLGKTGAMPKIEKALQPIAPSAGAMRAVMARQQQISKNPLLRMRQRHLLRLRDTFDKIAKRKETTINPEMLPDATKKKMVIEALENGHKMTPFGTVAQAMKKTNFNYAEWKRWEHALFDGSYIVAPKMKKP